MERAVEGARKPYLSIRPTRGWAALDLPGVWKFRDLLLALAGRDVKLRYKQTALGIAWVVLQPLMASGIFTFVFGFIAKMHSDKPFLLVSFVGLLGWNLFNTTVTKASTCLIGNSQLVSKIYFPRLILPLSTIPSALIDFLVALPILVLLMLAYRVAPPAALALIPLWIVILLMLSAGVGFWASALTVGYRDVQYIVPVILQMLLYASPVPYDVPSKAQLGRYYTLYHLNPLAPVIEGFRWSLIGTERPEWQFVAYAAAVSLVFLFAGAFMFKRMERKFADVI